MVDLGAGWARASSCLFWRGCGAGGWFLGLSEPNPHCCGGDRRTGSLNRWIRGFHHQQPRWGSTLPSGRRSRGQISEKWSISVTQQWWENHQAQSVPLVSRAPVSVWFMAWWWRTGDVAPISDLNVMVCVSARLTGGAEDCTSLTSAFVLLRSASAPLTVELFSCLWEIWRTDLRWQDFFFCEDVRQWWFYWFPNGVAFDTRISCNCCSVFSNERRQAELWQ